MTARRYGYARSIQQGANPKAEPSLDALVRDYMGAALPVSDGVAPGDAVVAGSGEQSAKP
jgi:general secretion pathway protein D